MRITPSASTVQAVTEWLTAQYRSTAGPKTRRPARLGLLSRTATETGPSRYRENTSSRVGDDLNNTACRTSKERWKRRLTRSVCSDTSASLHVGASESDESDAGLRDDRTRGPEGGDDAWDYCSDSDVISLASQEDADEVVSVTSGLLEKEQKDDASNRSRNNSAGKKLDVVVGQDKTSDSSPCLDETSF